MDRNQAPIAFQKSEELTRAASEAAKRPSSKYRTIFISDTHLGSAGAQHRALLDFIKYNDCEKLYLVGDIVDGWQLKRKWFWPQPHNDVIQKLLRKARNGTEVIYIPGNHDEFARQFLGLSFGGVIIKNSDIHVTADGTKFWIVHGDFFDNVIQHARWLAYVGDFAYTKLLTLNRWLNLIRRRFNLPYWSFSQYLKLKVKSAVSFISAFESVMIRETKKYKCDGVICGHIHKAEIKMIDGMIYANSGDWVESGSALVEKEDGQLEIIYWNETGLVSKHSLAETSAPPTSLASNLS